MQTHSHTCRHAHIHRCGLTYDHTLTHTPMGTCTHTHTCRLAQSHSLTHPATRVSTVPRDLPQQINVFTWHRGFPPVVCGHSAQRWVWDDPATGHSGTRRDLSAHQGQGVQLHAHLQVRDQPVRLAGLWRAAQGGRASCIFRPGPQPDCGAGHHCWLQEPQTGEQTPGTWGLAHWVSSSCVCVCVCKWVCMCEHVCVSTHG